MSPMYVGRLRSGTVTEMIKMAPEKIPAAPTPATARPMMRAVEFGATPQMSEPSSKMKSAMRYTHLME
jgi:hypothetical protein